MKRFIYTLGIVGLTLGLFLGIQATPAAALPTIDGAFSPASEWDGAFIQAFDINEAGITNTYDIKEFRLINDATGVYMLVTTYDPATMVDQDPLFLPRVSVSIALDYNGNGIFTEAVDRNYVHTADAAGGSQTFEVRDGTGLLLLSGTEGTHFKQGSVYEYFIPAASGGNTVPGTVLGFLRLDNGADDADDRLPDAMFITPVPEPTRLSFLGLGMLGLFGSKLRRRRRVA